MGQLSTVPSQPPFVPQELLDAAAAHPDQIYRVIVQGRPALPVGTVEAGVQQTMASAPSSSDSVNGAFSSISAVAAELTGDQIVLLAGDPLIFAITPDMPLRASVADSPVALEPPTVTGTPETGATLTASPGQWSGAQVEYAYQWQRCDATPACADIAGATGSTYDVAAEDVGSTLVVVVSATNADGSAASTSGATAVVDSAPPPVAQIVPVAPLVAPNVTGTAAIGELLSADDGVWSAGGPFELARRWQRCSAAGDACLDIAGETAPTYLVGADDAGSTLRVLVSATDAFGTGLVASTPTDVVPAPATAAPPPPPPSALTAPTVAGTTTVGETLTADDGSWSGQVELARQWQRCAADGQSCLDIAAATGQTYVLAADDAGFTLRVVVTATDANGSAAAASDATALVATAAAPPPALDPPAPLVAPALTGLAVQGETLAVDDGTWSGDAPGFAVQWQRCAAAGDACVDVDAAVAHTYALGPDDVGSTMRAAVTATDAAGSTAATSQLSDVVVSSATAANTSGEPPHNLAAPSVTGTATAGETLSAADGSWTGAARFDRQWQRCLPSGDGCVDIGGEHASTYVLAADDVGSTVRIVIDARNGSGGTAASSSVTAVVAGAAAAPTSGGGGGTSAPPVNVSLPTTDGTPAARSALVAAPGTWQAGDDHIDLTYRWERCDATGGGTCMPVGLGRTYTPTNADVGSTLHVVVTASDHGVEVSATSAATDRVAPYSPSGFFSWQLGPYAANLDAQWNAVAAADATPPAIAVVDSGVDASLPGLEGSVVQQVTLTSLPQSTAADGYGHGSFVAQVAAGHGRGEAGAAPKAPIVSLDVMNDDGMALTSDVVAAADWIYTHKDEHNIRVANFSLIGSSPSSVMFDPLDRELEHLWLSGVVVVTAAGNFAVDGQQSDMPFSPANDPFAITVGAADTSGTVAASDDVAAPWSAYGHTLDGFAKPELGAPGRYVVASVPTDSTLYLERPDRIVAPGKLELSGTSFAAPMVSGVAADLLALHPDWTPDQVKGALMLSAAQPGTAAPFSLGVGELDGAAALAVTDPPNPNAALERFVGPDPNGSATPVFDTASWGTTARADASWGTASWGTASWGTASWGTASWGTDYWSSASWGTASWGTASWGTASWGTASWGTASWGTASWGTDNAKADILPGGGYPMTWAP